MSVQTDLFAKAEAERSNAAAMVEEVVGEGFDVTKFEENFEVLTDAAGGIRALRQLVLDLAVRGRLARQVEGEGEAVAVLQTIEKRRAELVAARKASRADNLPAVSAKDVPFPIPRSWEWTRLGVATVCRDGQRIPVSRAERAGREGPYDYYGASGVIDKIDRYIFNEQLLLVGEDGANLLNRSTPIAFIASGRYWVNNHAHVLDSASPDMLRYLSVFLNAIDLTPYVTGTAQPKMNQAKMNTIPVAVPPIAEQKRIVAKVDQLMGLIDELEAKQTKKREVQTRFRTSALDALTKAEGVEELASAWNRVAGNFGVLFERVESVAVLRNLILESAFLGRLATRLGGDDEVPSLLRKIEAAWLGRRTKEPLLDVAQDEIPPSPEHWAWVRLGNLAEVVGGVTKGRDLRGRKVRSFPYLRVANVQRGFLDLDVMKEIEIPEDELAKYRLLPGDVLFTEGGDWDKLGRSTLWRGEIDPCIHQNHVFRARMLVPELDPAWFSGFANSPLGRRYFEGAAKQTTNLASINMTQLKNCPMPIPPLAEQKRIVVKVEALMKLCDDLEAKLKAKEQTAGKLVEAVVKELVA